MDTFIKDTETGEIYYCDLYEKWWYHFFLIFAVFLPHHCRKVEDTDLFYQVNKNNILKKGTNSDWAGIVGVIFGKVIVEVLPDIKLNWIGKEYFILIFIIYYFLWVLGSYLFKKMEEKNLKELLDTLSTVNKKVQYHGLNLKKKNILKIMAFLLLVAGIWVIVEKMLINEVSSLMLILTTVSFLVICPIMSYILAKLSIYRSEDRSKYEHIDLREL